MSATSHRWSEIPEEPLIPLLTRRMFKGEKALVAKVHLAKGCHVNAHSHPSEQISVMISGHLLWTIGDQDQYQVETKPGEIMHLPSNVVHSVDALEDSEVFDVLSPIGPMGVDTQTKQQ